MEPGEAGNADDEFADGRAPRRRPGADDLQFQETHIQDVDPVFADEVGRGGVGPVARQPLEVEDTAGGDRVEGEALAQAVGGAGPVTGPLM